MTEHDDADEATLELLRAALRGTAPTGDDAPPAMLTEGAYWIHDWATADAELAELEHDSRVHADAGAARSTSTAARTLTFHHGHHVVDLEIAAADATTTIRGYVTPATFGTATAVVSGEPHQSAIDELGEFVVTGQRAGSVVLRLELGDDRILALPAFTID